jgi:hypothetical protein
MKRNLDTNASKHDLKPFIRYCKVGGAYMAKLVIAKFRCDKLFGLVLMKMNHLALQLIWGALVNFEKNLLKIKHLGLKKFTRIGDTFELHCNHMK